MFENLKKFIQGLRTADETKKKRWLFILSALSMILIISFWAIYLNKTIVNLGPTEPKKTGQSSIQISKESPWQVFLTGSKIIIGQIKELMTATREISIEGNSSNFATSSEAVSPEILP